MSLKLKVIEPSKVPPTDRNCTSSTFHPSEIPTSYDSRDYYLHNPSLVPAPLISCSAFVPPSLVQHLMRNKKNAAIAVKFSAYSGTDQITNMEGAMHTFVTPVIPRCEMVGDYVFRGSHGIAYFGPSGRVKLTRSVVLSASIQPDFENDKVMLAVSKLSDEKFMGRDLAADGKWEILSTTRKQDHEQRHRYDAGLRAHMVYHLTRAHCLPPKSHVKKEDALSSASTITFLEVLINQQVSIGHNLAGRYLKIGHNLLSLELLYNTLVQQLRNEFSALEVLCPQGYVYTYDPAAIFAGEIGAKVLNRLMLCALKTLSEHNHFAHMKIFAFNEYAEPGIIPLVRTALKAQQQVRVLRKEDLFQGKGKLYEVEKFPGCQDAMLVLHNNSDAFGQNIETEGMGGSLDGAIGTSSSAAASLGRAREDLLDFVSW